MKECFTGLWAQIKGRGGKLSSEAVPDEGAGETHPSGWFRPQNAGVLLSTPLRRQLIRVIWQRTSLPAPLFGQLYHKPLARFAERVQLLPASEYHHHAYPGGLLDHSLEVMAFAAKLRQRCLLPPGAEPEDQARDAEAWTAGVLYAALLHDLGKVTADMEIVTGSGASWYPWMGAPAEPYRLTYRRPRDYHLHPVAGSIMVTQILPVCALNWLARQPDLYALFLYCISGHYERAGVIGELVQEADKASVAKFMGGKAENVLNHPQPSLAKQMLMALRDLVLTQYRLNNPESGSDGWLTDDALWLISKTTADRIRAWLLQHGVISVPDNNIRLFDEMQSYGLIIPTPEGRAIWSCDIRADKGWAPSMPLTVLKLSPDRIWPDPSQRPAVFSGQVVPASAPSDVPGEPVSDTVLTEEEEDACTSLALSLFTPAEDVKPELLSAKSQRAETLASTTSPATAAPSALKTSYTTGATVPPQMSESTGGQFIRWLQDRVQKQQILVNDPKAALHMVDGLVFLVTPEIFKLYMSSTDGTAGEEWRSVQRSFQRLRLHSRNDEGLNIFTCIVEGPRKIRYVKGYLLSEPGMIFGDTIPEDNPFLSVWNRQADGSVSLHA
ncbi:MobH family relaxase [Scandinavium sp. M-37]|uniref:MobH family relaxase n=1 Tax=Scandinavium sp. M-37 TaxID=3373077 RepID=UPI003745ECEF